MDNVAKCVLDALNKVAYNDDKQVRVQKSNAYSIDKVINIKGEAIDIIEPLRKYKEYIYIRIRKSLEVI